MEIGKPEKKIRIVPVEEPVPSPLPMPEPVEEPAPTEPSETEPLRSRAFHTQPLELPVGDTTGATHVVPSRVPLLDAVAAPEHLARRGARGEASAHRLARAHE